MLQLTAILNNITIETLVCIKIFKRRCTSRGSVGGWGVCVRLGGHEWFSGGGLIDKINIIKEITWKINRLKKCQDVIKNLLFFVKGPLKYRWNLKVDFWYKKQKVNLLGDFEFMCIRISKLTKFINLQENCPDKIL